MSSFTLYDKALKWKIQDVFNNVIISEPDLAFKRGAEREGEGGNVKLPLISIFREDNTIEDYNFNWRRLRRGERQQYLGSEEQVLQAVKAIPIRLDYQIDVFTEKERVADRIIEELLFFISADLTITVEPAETRLILINDKLYVNEFRIDRNRYSVEVIDNSGEASIDMSVGLEDNNLKINLGTDSSGSLDSSKNQISAIIEEINNIKGFRAFSKPHDDDYLDSGYEQTDITGMEKDFGIFIEDIVDNSELMGFEERGRYYRKTIMVYIDNARLYMSELTGEVLEVDYSMVKIEEN